MSADGLADGQWCPTLNATILCARDQVRRVIGVASKDQIIQITNSNSTSRHLLRLETVHPEEVRW
jgi:hypothetical protein